MKTTRWFVLGMAAIGLLIASAVVPAPASAQSTPPPVGRGVKLLAKNFAGWSADTVFIPTTTVPTVTNFYTETVKTPAGTNVLDVLVSWQDFNIDEFFGIQCLVDGSPCMNGSINSLAAELTFPAGTIVMIDGDEDDVVGSSYNFCQTIVKAPKNLHSVVLNLLTIDDSTELFSIDVEVTSARIPPKSLATQGCAPGAVQGTFPFEL
jgi:hypothetical protein